MNDDNVKQGIRYGYIRVSTAQQENNYSLENQAVVLKEFGVDQVVKEVGSGKNIKDRPILKQLLDKTVSGDSIVVTKLDRLVRNTLDYLKLVQQMNQKNVKIICLDLPVSQNPALDQYMSTMLAALSDLELSIRRERQMSGISLAKLDRSKYPGRKSIITPKMIKTVDKLRKNGFTTTLISKSLGVSRTTIYKILKNHLGYQNNNTLTPKPPQNDSKNSNKKNDSKIDVN